MVSVVRTAARSTAEVFDDHLRSALEHDLEGDIRRNFSPDVVLLTSDGILRGHDGVRRSRTALRERARDAAYEYVNTLADGPWTFLEWRAISDTVEISDGADGFVIEDGLIRCQTIHYTVNERRRI